MTTFVKDYLERLEALHAEVEKALEGLPQVGLDWSPGPEMNSIAVQIVHLVGAERYWIGDIIAGDPSNRIREAEFQVRGLSSLELKRRLSDSYAYIHRRLATLSKGDLDDLRTSPRDGRAISVAWVLLQILEHTALHLGHIQVTRQLWHLRQIA